LLESTVASLKHTYFLSGRFFHIDIRKVTAIFLIRDIVSLKNLSPCAAHAKTFSLNDIGIFSSIAPKIRNGCCRIKSIIMPLNQSAQYLVFLLFLDRLQNYEAFCSLLFLPKKAPVLKGSVINIRRNTTSRVHLIKDTQNASPPSSSSTRHSSMVLLGPQNAMTNRQSRSYCDATNNPSRSF